MKNKVSNEIVFLSIWELERKYFKYTPYTINIKKFKGKVILFKVKYQDGIVNDVEERKSISF